MNEVDSLVSEIVASGGGREGELQKKLLHFLAKHHLGTETVRCELKQEFSGDSRAWAELSTHVLAMSNVGGGVIVFGLSDRGERIGLARSLASVFDSARVNDQFRRRTQATIATSYCELVHYRKTYGFLTVVGGTAPVVLDKEWAYQTQGEKPIIVARPGVVYVREPGQTLPAKQRHMVEIVRRVADAQSRAFLARIEAVAALPMGADLVVMDPNDRDGGYRLVSEGRGHPVRIVQEESKDAVPLAEILDPSVPFSSLNSEVLMNVRQWRQDASHRVRRPLQHRWYQGRSEIEFNDMVAEFCLLSSLDGLGFPMYWASRLSEARLRSVLTRELEDARYPSRVALPYVVGAFLWNDRASLLSPYLDNLQHARTTAELVMAESDRWFLTKSRYRSQRFKYEGDFLDFDLLLHDSVLSQQIFDRFLAQEIEDDAATVTNWRSVAHQLDIVLHARLTPKPSTAGSDPPDPMNQ